MLRFARSRSIALQHAEDAVQETLLAALEGLDRFGGKSAPSTWLNGILKHKIVDQMRLHGREQPLEALGEEPAAPGADPESAHERRQIAAAVQGGLDGLSVRAAEVFLLREVLGHEVAEVCKRLGISPANCWVLLHRARARLRACPEIGRLAAGS